MAALDDLLALLPDNTTGDISAADMRNIVTALWGKADAAAVAANDAAALAEGAATVAGEANTAAAAAQARADQAYEMAVSASVGSVSAVYQFAAQAGAPGGQQVSTDTGDLATATVIRFAYTDRQNVDMTGVIKKATKCHIQQKSNADNWAMVDLGVSFGDSGSYIEKGCFPIEGMGAGSADSAAWQEVAVTFYGFQA